MPKRDPQLLFSDMLEAARQILEYTEGLSLDNSIADSQTVDAVACNFEILVEALTRLPYEFKSKNDNIP